MWTVCSVKNWLFRPARCSAVAATRTRKLPQPARYAKQGLCNATVSVRPSVRLSVYPILSLKQRAAGLLLWARPGRRYRSIASARGRSTAHSSECGQCHFYSWRSVTVRYSSVLRISLTYLRIYSRMSELLVDQLLVFLMNAGCCRS